MRIDDGRLALSPSDIHHYLACRHRTALDVRRARGELELRRVPRPDAELIAERGRRHEAEFLQRLLDEGQDVARIGPDDAFAATEHAMREGRDVIYQAAFTANGWRGYADFLVRVDTPSALGEWSYEAYDTKLATHPQPYFVFQLLFYSDQIERLQGKPAERMHVVLGTREVRSFRTRDFAAYARQVRARFKATVEAYWRGEEPPYPYPVAHCAYCDWWLRCTDKRRADDHLSLVSALTRGQAVRLERAGVASVGQLAELGEDAEVDRLAHGTLAGLRQQARLQVASRGLDRPLREWLAPEPERGFARLPAPSAGDVFFDIEGDPYWGDQGLEYLLGSLTEDGYRAEWAHDRTEERAAFERWIDWLTARRTEHPDLHVYHYNHYEPTAVKSLMARYGTREHEVDELLRGEVFVDLYAVVRQAMRIGTESLSLKSIEAMYALDRDTEVTEAGGSILAYQEWLASHDETRLAAIEEYNRDDCRSTLALRDWLLEEKADAERELGVEIDALAPAAPRERTPEQVERDARLDALEGALVAGLDEDVEALEPAQRMRVIAADLLRFHRREARPAWWAFFERLERSSAELCAEDTEAIGGLELVADAPVEEDRQSLIYELRFPPQQHKIGPGRRSTPPAASRCRSCAWTTSAGDCGSSARSARARCRRP